MARPYVNLVVLMGEMVDKPRVGTLTNGTKVANFILRTRRSWRSNGESREKVEDHECVAYNPPHGFMIADKVEEWARPDDTVYVEGRIESRSFKNRDGVAQTTMQVVCSEFKVVDNW